jgi:hypothetical protein
MLLSKPAYPVIDMAVSNNGQIKLVKANMFWLSARDL